MTSQIQFARNQEKEICILTGMANRHGLITGATGTGKTVTLQSLAERFSEMGIPCFMADIKGDLSGIARPGGDNQKVQERVRELGLQDYAPKAHPVTFWDVFGEQGHPIRATVSDLGPLLLSRMLELNEVQAGVLNLVFKVADDNGLLLLDMKDLREMLKYVGGNASAFTTDYGTIAPASVGAIQRGLLNLESQGGDHFFGEPMLNVSDLMQTDQGRGVINILAADRLMGAPKLYAMVLLWLLSELFENLPERGDLEKPGLVFFFDEAHLLFEGAPTALVEKIEQVVRLIRSKGVGVFFVTQNPTDIPDKVLAQLGNRIQHALRSFSARDLKQVRASAQAMRDNPTLDEETVITDLGVGEALISCLDEQGRPSVVERAMIYPPLGMVGPLSTAERQEMIRSSLVAGVYEQRVDRESAYERLKNRVDLGELPTGGGTDRQTSSGNGSPGTVGGVGGIIGEMLGGSSGGGRRREGVVETMAKSVARSVGSQVGRAIVRGLLGSILGGRR